MNRAEGEERARVPIKTYGGRTLNAMVLRLDDGSIF